MTFEELLDQAIDLLQRRGHVTYRTLKRQFHLDDDVLEDLKEEIIYGQRLAVDEDGRVLVWTGGASATSKSIAFPSLPQKVNLPQEPSRRPGSPRTLLRALETFAGDEEAWHEHFEEIARERQRQGEEA